MLAGDLLKIDSDNLSAGELSLFAFDGL